MGADFGYKVYVTKGELATIMGALAYGMARVALKAAGFMLHSPSGQIPGAAIIEVLDNTTGVYLDNPEVSSLLDLLAGNGVIDAATRAKVSDYVAAQLAAPNPDTGLPNNLRTWQLSSDVASIAEYIEFISPYLVFSSDTSVSCGAVGVFSIDGYCTHPDAVEVL